MKEYLLNTYREEICAKDTSFKIGFYGDSNKKLTILSERQLTEVYNSAKNGNVTIWVDPHEVPSSRKRKGKSLN